MDFSCSESQHDFKTWTTARSVELWSLIFQDAFFVNVRPTSGEEHGVVTDASRSKSLARNGCRGSRSSEVPLFHANQPWQGFRSKKVHEFNGSRRDVLLQYHSGSLEVWPDTRPPWSCAMCPHQRCLVHVKTWSICHSILDDQRNSFARVLCVPAFSRPDVCVEEDLVALSVLTRCGW